MQILTHRGLDPSRKPYFKESSYEAFADKLARGFGLEFDLQFTKDHKIIVNHDAHLTRLSDGTDNRLISDIASDEMLAMEFSGCHLTDLLTLLRLIEEESAPETLSALHLKYVWQEKKYLDLLLNILKNSDPKKYIIFDITTPTAQYLKEHMPSLILAPSVAHPYDIIRYSGAVGNTLLSLDEAIDNRDIFSWVWLDEWDRRNADGGQKSLYTEEVFSKLRAGGFGIALISPELHATSPALLGGESHEDAADQETLRKRMQEIADLKPDLICTDYPDTFKELCTDE